MRLPALLIFFGLLAAACSDDVNSFAAIASSEGSVGVGEQRVLVAIIDFETNEFLATEDVTPIATLRDGIGAPLGEYTGEFVWTIPDVRGLYAFDVDIPGPATYQLTVDAGELGDLGPIGLVAVDDPFQVAVGEAAPRSETRTVDDAPLSDLTSDPNPDPAFYEMTVAQAIEAGPSVVVFATPAWCTSQACGPMLDQAKEVAGVFPGVNFVHVEVYENIHVTERSDLILVPAVEEWGLPSEPWLYVIDDRGVVTAAFEGAVSDAELDDAIGAVAP